MIEIIPNWHPMFVHFTVALVSISVVFHLLATFTRSESRRQQWQVVAKWTLWSGALITVATLIAGLYAYNTVAHDEPSHQAMTLHRNWAIVTAVLIFIAAGWSFWFDRRQQSTPAAFLVLVLVTGAMVSATGWLGAEAVYRYGLGVMSLPKAEGEGHAHEHAGEGHGEMKNSVDGAMPQVQGAHQDDDHAH